MVTVAFTSALRSATGGVGEVTVEPFEGDLATLLARLVERLGPQLSERLVERGEVRRFVNVYVDGLDVRFTGGLRTPVPPGATVDFIPAVAGG